jgi:hypothetical protein
MEILAETVIINLKLESIEILPETISADTNSNLLQTKTQTFSLSMVSHLKYSILKVTTLVKATTTPSVLAAAFTQLLTRVYWIQQSHLDQI